MINHPSEIEWIEGDLPDIHTVPKNCMVLVWFVTDVTQEEWEQCDNSGLAVDHNGRCRRIEMCLPYENFGNPLRWCDSSGMPIGYHEKAAQWAWLKKGTPTESVDSAKVGF